jgi:hypothetical protein
MKYLLIASVLVFLLCVLYLFYNKEAFTSGISSTSGSSGKLVAETNIFVVMVTNQPNDDRLRLLKQSLVKAGFDDYEIKVLSTGDKFSWAKRMDAWKEFYDSCAPNTIILSLDAFDVFVLENTRGEIIDKFQSSGHKVLFGSTNYCWPMDCDTCINRKGRTEFLCAGTYIGYAGVLSDIMTKHAWDEKVDDQCYFSTIYREYPEFEIGLDTTANLFQSTTLTAELESKDKRVINKQTSTNPCVLHYDSAHLTYEKLLSHTRDILKLH